MVDTDLLVATLRQHGHTVGHVIPVPSNAGNYEFEVDGTLLSLDEARLLVESDDARAEPLARV